MQRLIIIFEQVSEGCSSKRVQKAGNTGTMTLCDDKGDGKPKRRCNRPNRGRAQCKRSYQLLSSRYRAIASAGAILVAMHVATSPSRANALSWIDAARATGDAGRCSASDAKTGAVSTISRSCATGTCTSPAASSLGVLPSSASAHGYVGLVDSTPCLGHASTGTSMYSSDALSGDSTRNGTPRRINYFVVGTSHFRCDSADEVERIIREIGPDGVVVELDPERVIRLTKEGSKYPDEEQLFGADFFSAIDTAKDMDVPLFIGDEYSKETRARFVQTVPVTVDLDIA